MRYPKLTVVVPIYNVAPYLDRCLKSILSQSFSNFELICINDASTDDSLQIVHKYAAADHRIKVIDFSVNKGVGAARNAGIWTAQGETICFCDPDDFLPENALAVRYALYAQYGCVVKARRIDLTPDGRVTRMDSYSHSLADAPFSPEEDIASIDLLDHHTAWLFPTSWLHDNAIEYKEGMKNAEDLYFLANSFFYIDKLICTNEPAYCVVHRHQSATNRKSDAEYYKNILSCADMFYQESASKNKILYGDYYFNKRIIHTLTRIIENIKRDSMLEEEYEKIIEYGMFLFKKYNVFLRYKNDEFLKLFSGIHLLVRLSLQERGSILYRIYKEQKAMKKLYAIDNLW